MKNSYLFPAYFKKIGWCMFPFMLAFSIYVLYIKNGLNWDVSMWTFVSDSRWLETSDSKWFGTSVQDISDEIAFTGMTVSLLFIAFAKRKDEDEYISRTRLESLVWAVIANYAILTAATWLVYGFPYFNVMLYNMFTILILFIVKFQLALYKLKKSMRNEE